MDHLRDVVRRHGLPAQFVFGTLDTLARLGRPSILFFPVGHFSVLESFDPKIDAFRLCDPRQGRMWLTRHMMKSRWIWRRGQGIFLTIQ